MHRVKNFIKRFFLGVLLLIIAFCIYYWKEVTYGISQAYGQLHIVWKAKPVEKVLNDPNFPDSLKAKIRLIQEIRQYAFDSIGLNHSKNYTTVFDQKGKPLLWNVTGAEPFKLKAKEWSFPFAGTFSYKGFFNHDKAVEEERKLKQEGWDTDISEVSGWSTLGWFKDPILTSMLKRSSGSLSNLIIHELTHGTLYVKNNVQFNENLASFVGDKGAEMFLIHKFGRNSDPFKEYVKWKEFNDSFNKRVLFHADRLDSLYLQIQAKPEEEKLKLKTEFLNEIKTDLSNFLRIYKFDKKSRIVNEISHLNNTFFLDYRRYTEDLSGFEKEFKVKFGGDLKKYLNYLKERYPSL